MIKNRAVKILVIVLLLVAAVAIYFSINPATSKYFPRCFFYTVTGYKCPGCGSQRAIHAILNGNFVEALSYNAFLLVSIPIIVFYLLNDYTKVVPSRVSEVATHPVVIAGLCVAIVLWWVLRNVFGW